MKDNTFISNSLAALFKSHTVRLKSCRLTVPCYILTYVKRAQSRYFELFLPHTKSPLSGRKPKNSSLIRKKNTKEIMINRKGTRMAKDRED